MTEGSKAAWHAAAVVFSFIAALCAVVVAVRGAIHLDYAWLSLGLGGLGLAALNLRDVLRNRPGL